VKYGFKQAVHKLGADSSQAAQFVPVHDSQLFEEVFLNYPRLHG
jgi:hypothetical protein